MDKDSIIRIIKECTVDASEHDWKTDSWMHYRRIDDVEKLAYMIMSLTRDVSAQIGELEAKVTAYEAILNNSNFKMAVVRKNKNGNHDGASKD